jgi:hypothetical protein
LDGSYFFALRIWKLKDQQVPLWQNKSQYHCPQGPDAQIQYAFCRQVICLLPSNAFFLKSVFSMTQLTVFQSLDVAVAVSE